MTRAKSILSGPSKTSARVCHLHGRIARRAEVFLTRHGNAHSTDNDCTGPNQEIIGNESRSLSVKIVLTVRIFFTAVIGNNYFLGHCQCYSNTQWETMFKILLVYKDANGNCNGPSRYVIDGINLSSWV